MAAAPKRPVRKKTNRRTLAKQKPEGPKLVSEETQTESTPLTSPLATKSATETDLEISVSIDTTVDQSTSSVGDTSIAMDTSLNNTLASIEPAPNTDGILSVDANKKKRGWVKGVPRKNYTPKDTKKVKKVRRWGVKPKRVSYPVLGFFFFSQFSCFSFAIQCVCPLLYRGDLPEIQRRKKLPT